MPLRVRYVLRPEEIEALGTLKAARAATAEEAPYALGVETGLSAGLAAEAEDL